MINRHAAPGHTCDAAFPIEASGRLMWPALCEVEHAAHLPLMSLWPVLQLCAVNPDPGPDTKRYEIPLLLPLPESTHPAHPFINAVGLHASQSAQVRPVLRRVSRPGPSCVKLSTRKIYSTIRANTIKIYARQVSGSATDGHANQYLQIFLRSSRRSVSGACRHAKARTAGTRLPG